MAEIDDLAAQVAINNDTLNVLVSNTKNSAAGDAAIAELADLKAKIAATTVELKRQDDAASAPAADTSAATS